MPQKV